MGHRMEISPAGPNLISADRQVRIELTGNTLESASVGSVHPSRAPIWIDDQAPNAGGGFGDCLA
jgi:hypothetical protein